MIPPPLPPSTKPLPLNQALRVYWKNLIGVALFPPVLFIGGSVYNLTFGILFPLFFGAGFSALWPLLKRRVLFDFWAVAMVVWMVIIILSIVALQSGIKPTNDM